MEATTSEFTHVNCHLLQLPLPQTLLQQLQSKKQANLHHHTMLNNLSQTRAVMMKQLPYHPHHPHHPLFHIHPPSLSLTPSLADYMPEYCRPPAKSLQFTSLFQLSPPAWLNLKLSCQMQNSHSLLLAPNHQGPAVTQTHSAKMTRFPTS